LREFRKEGLEIKGGVRREAIKENQEQMAKYFLFMQ
jgi:hypothetical protein